MVALMLWSKSTIVSLGQSFFLISSRVTILPLRSTSIRRARSDCSLSRTLLLASAVPIEHSSPDSRSSSKLPKRTRVKRVFSMKRSKCTPWEFLMKRRGCQEPHDDSKLVLSDQLVTRPIPNFTVKSPPNYRQCIYARTGIYDHVIACLPVQIQ